MREHAAVLGGVEVGRIAFLVTGLERGGAELQVMQLVHGLRQRGWNAEVFSLRPGPLAPDARLFPSGLAKFRPHILHAHLFHANVAARIARLWFPIPVVLSTIHSLAESARGSDRIWFRDLLYRVTNRLADANVFVSRAAAHRHGASHSRVLPIGISLARFTPRLGPREPGPFRWLAAGRLLWKKNYPLLLEAMRAQADATLLIAGDGPDAEKLRALAPDNVRFLGARDDVPVLMQHADGFVLTSKVEGLPTVLIEAAASGVPAVATDVGGVSEVVVDGVTGLLAPPGDASALAAAMARLRATDYAAMGRAAREHAVAHFDIERVLDQWERLYREFSWT